MRGRSANQAHLKRNSRRPHSAALPVGTLSWGAKKNSQRAYRAICDIPLDISREELERRLKIFGGNYFGVAPTIRLHGVEFRAVV